MKEYFSVLLNEEFLCKKEDERNWNNRLVNKINKIKVRNMIIKMKCRKAAGPDRFTY